MEEPTADRIGSALTPCGARVFYHIAENSVNIAEIGLLSPIDKILQLCYFEGEKVLPVDGWLPK